MTSNINSANIDQTYPVAGQDNDSQGFRTNFTNIKNNFTYAKAELDDLQSKVILKSALTGTTLDNNFAGALIKGAEIRDLRETRVDLGTTGGTVELSHTSAHSYAQITNASTTLSFTGFPAAGKIGRFRYEVSIASTAHTLTLPAAVTYGLDGIAGLDSDNVITFTETGTYVFEFFTDNGGTDVHINELSRARTKFQSAAIQLVQSTPTNTGAEGDVAGMMAVGSDYMYICTGTYDGSTVIWKRAAFAAF